MVDHNVKIVYQYYKNMLVKACIIEWKIVVELGFGLIEIWNILSPFWVFELFCCSIFHFCLNFLNLIEGVASTFSTIEFLIFYSSKRVPNTFSNIMTYFGQGSSSGFQKWNILTKTFFEKLVTLHEACFRGIIKWYK